MVNWIEDLAAEVELAGVGGVSVERLRAASAPAPDLAGLFMTSTGSGCALDIEVWLGAEGWVLSIDSVLHEELPFVDPDSRSRVERLIWGVIYGGAGLYTIGREHFLIFGNHHELATATAEELVAGAPIEVNQWCAWIPEGDPPVSSPSVAVRVSSSDLRRMRRTKGGVVGRFRRD